MGAIFTFETQLVQSQHRHPSPDTVGASDVDPACIAGRDYGRFWFIEQR